jgi:hypothetical protein
VTYCGVRLGVTAHRAGAQLGEERLECAKVQSLKPCENGAPAGGQFSGLGVIKRLPRPVEIQFRHSHSMVCIDPSEAVTPFALPWMDVQGNVRTQGQEGCWGRQGGEAALCSQMPSVKQLLASMRGETAFSRFVPSNDHIIDFSR